MEGYVILASREPMVADLSSQDLTYNRELELCPKSDMASESKGEADAHDVE